MGCSGSRPTLEGLHVPLDYKFDELGSDFNNLDEIFKEASDTFKHLEENRKSIIDDRDDVIIKSGASSYKNPKVEYCLEGILWKLSADNDGSLTNAEIQCNIDTKVLSLEGKQNSKEIKEAFKLLWNYLIVLSGMPENMSQISNKIKEIKDKLMSQGPTIEKEVMEKIKHSDPQTAKSIVARVEKYQKNVFKISTLSNMFPLINEELKHSIEVFMIIPQFVETPEEVEKIDIIGSKAKVQKIKNINEVTWKLMPYTDLRFGEHPEDGINYWNEMKRLKTLYN